MKRFDPVRCVPLTIVPVLLCFLLDLTRVDPAPIESSTPEAPTGYLLATPIDAWSKPLTMADYVPLALMIIAPFGFGVLGARRTPGISLLLLLSSAFIALFLLDLNDYDWVPALFPAVIIAGVLAAFACIDQWAHAGQITRTEGAAAEESKA